MGKLKPQSAHPNVNVTLADRVRRQSPPTGTWFRHIFRDSAPIFCSPFCFQMNHSFSKGSNPPFQMPLGARGK
jgi:hypothetical protein